jgi:hypothetical protein
MTTAANAETVAGGARAARRFLDEAEALSPRLHDYPAAVGVIWLESSEQSSRATPTGPKLCPRKVRGSRADHRRVRVHSEATGCGSDTRRRRRRPSASPLSRPCAARRGCFGGCRRVLTAPRLRQRPRARRGEGLSAESANLRTGDKVHSSHYLASLVRWIVKIEVADGNAVGPPHDLKPSSRPSPASGILESNAQSDKAPCGRILGARGRGRGGIAVDDRFHLVDGKLTQHQPLRFDLLGAEPTRVASTSHPVNRYGTCWPQPRRSPYFVIQT